MYMMGFVIVLAIYGIISLGVHFACAWFSKKECDNWDVMASFAFLWILFPFAFIIHYSINYMMYILEYVERLKNKMLEYKAVRERRQSEVKYKCHIIDQKIDTLKKQIYTDGGRLPFPGVAVSSHAPKVGARLIYNDDSHMLEPSIKIERDPLLVEAEQEVEQLLNERKL